MKTKIVEATNHPTGFNVGRFLLMKFDADEWAYKSRVESHLLVAGRGWDHKHIWVMDLATGEGALFRPGGMASADLDKHKIWVCPMFEPFLAKLYEHPEWWDLDNCPSVVQLTEDEAPSDFRGYRRAGPEEDAA